MSPQGTDERSISDAIERLLDDRRRLEDEIKRNRDSVSNLRKDLAIIRARAKTPRDVAWITKNGETPFLVRRNAMAEARRIMIRRLVENGMGCADVARALKLSYTVVKKMHERAVRNNEGVGEEQSDE